MHNENERNKNEKLRQKRGELEYGFAVLQIISNFNTVY